MPVNPPNITTPYDTWTQALNATRRRVRSRMPSLVAYSGNILDDSQAETLQAAINAYRRLQDRMCDEGVTRFRRDTVIFQIPIVQNSDPASTCSLSWTECFDGEDYIPAPVLPGDMIRPLWMSERPSGQNANFPSPSRPNMTICNDGVPKRTKWIFNREWQWRNDTLYYPGATQMVDFWIYYESYLPDPADVGNQRWFTTGVPIMRSQDALSWYLCGEYAIGLAASATDPMVAGSASSFAEMCEMKADEAAKKLVNRDIGPKERGDTRRRPYGNGGGSGRRGAWW